MFNRIDVSIPSDGADQFKTIVRSRNIECRWDGSIVTGTHFTIFVHSTADLKWVLALCATYAASYEVIY